MAPVWFPDPTVWGRWVDAHEFTDKVYLHWEHILVTGLYLLYHKQKVCGRVAIRFTRENVKRVVDTVAHWLRDVLTTAIRRGGDPVAAVVTAYDPLLLPECVRSIEHKNDTQWRRMAHFVVDRVCRATAHELPYWGYNRVRRANRLFSEAYPELACARRPGHRRSVTFAPQPERVMNPESQPRRDGIQ